MFSAAAVAEFGRLAGNHLWQSTVFGAAAALLALTLRGNRASVRHWLWLAASVKFLVPFAGLAVIGGWLGRWVVPAGRTAAYVPVVVGRVVEPFAGGTAGVFVPQPVPVQGSGSWVWPVLIAVWALGLGAVAIYSWRRWRRVARVVRGAVPITAGREMMAWRRIQDKKADQEVRPALVCSAAALEPGVFGIFRPLIWLPAGIGDRLSDSELEAILAHELCHVWRRDNLTSFLHMVVEALFWFHPLVWWMGARLTEERERACDEEVIRMGGAPHVYAESILKVCEHYLASPLACAAGVTGGELRKRIEGIMANRFTAGLSKGKRALLAAAAVLCVAGPVVVGISAQSETGLKFEVASIRPTVFPNDAFAAGVRAGAAAGDGCGGGMLAVKGTLVSVTTATVCGAIKIAYDVKGFQVTGVPATLGPMGDDKGGHVSLQATIQSAAKLPPAFYDIEARAPGPEPPTEAQAREMLRSLLRDRFALNLHRESRDTAYWALVPAKDGPKLKPAVDNCKPGGSRELFHVCGMTMPKVADYLEAHSDKPVLDMTGIPGKFDYDIPAAMDFETSRAAVQEVLKLKVELRHGPVEFLVVDHVERPTEN